MIESSFYTVLTANTAVTALAGTNIFPLLLPDNPTLPAIDYQFLGGSVTSTFSTRGVAKWRVEVNCWGNTYADAVNLRAAVTKALDGYADANFTCRLIAPQDFFDHTLLQYRAMCEFYVWFNLPE